MAQLSKKYRMRVRTCGRLATPNVRGTSAMVANQTDSNRRIAWSITPAARARILRLECIADRSLQRIAQSHVMCHGVVRFCQRQRGDAMTVHASVGDGCVMTDLLRSRHVARRHLRSDQVLESTQHNLLMRTLLVRVTTGQKSQKC